MVSRFWLTLDYFIEEIFSLIDKQQSPGAIARSASANELALRKKNNLLSKICH